MMVGTDGGSPSDTKLTAEMAMRMRKKEDIRNDSGDSRGGPQTQKWKADNQEFSLDLEVGGAL